MKTYPLYLNGDFVPTDETVNVVNPATGETFARMSIVDRARVAKAVRDAHDAFQSWRKVSGKGRGELLQRIANQLERRREEIARVITQENGKPLSQSLGEVAFAVDHLRWFAEEARRISNRIMPHQVDSKRHMILKTPMGAVAAISPWNFPLMLAVRKVAAALAAGCTVLLKPSARAPLAALAFAECVAEVGLPRGVFQMILTQAPSDFAMECNENPLCRKISFTGSTDTGKKLVRLAAQSLKPLSLELGGHAPVLVFDDCDLKEAVSAVLLAKFRNCGQSCLAANRIYVQRAVYHDFTEAFTERVRQLEVGNGLEPKTQVGPLISENACERAAEHVLDAVNGGAKLLCGGERIDRPGYFFQPTVMADVPRRSLCMFEETFAPIAPITPFDREADGLELANDSPYGLSSYVFTRDVGRMFRLAETIEAGMVAINDGLPTTSQCPFGGVKQSGWGRELGTEGMEAFLDTKHVSLGVE